MPDRSHRGGALFHHEVGGQMLEDDAALWQFAHGASVLEGRRASCRRDLLAARGSFGGRWVEHHGDQIAGPDLAHKQLAAALVPVASRHEGAKPQVVGAYVCKDDKWRALLDRRPDANSARHSNGTRQPAARAQKQAARGSSS